MLDDPPDRDGHRRLDDLPLDPAIELRAQRRTGQLAPAVGQAQL